MLDKELLLKLNKEQKYDEIWNEFVKEYKRILTDFFIKKDVIKEDKYSFLELLNRLKNFENGKYDEVYYTLSEMYHNEGMKYSQILNEAIDNYKIIKEKLAS